MSKKLSQVSVALMFSPPVINGKFQCLRRNSKTFRKRKQILFFSSLYFESWTFDGVESTENVTAVDIDLICLLFPHPTQISFSL